LLKACRPSIYQAQPAEEDWRLPGAALPISSNVQRLSFVAVMLATGAGCDGEWFTTGPYVDPCKDGLVAPASVKLDRSSVALRIGATANVAASALEKGGSLEPCPITGVWSSSDVAVAIVTTGFGAGASIQAVGNGTAWIKVRFNNVADSVQVTVATPPIDLLSVTASHLLVGQSVQAVVSATGSAGEAITGWSISSWTTSNAGVALVSPEGVVRAVGEGSAIISATVEGITANTRVDVTRGAPDVRVNTISMGGGHGCAIVSGATMPAGTIVCWGGGLSGQLGAGDFADKSIPRRVSGSNFYVAVDAGRAQTCAISVAGDAWCWGGNDFGELGDGTTARRSVPVKVSGSVKFSSIAAGDFHTCALSTAGEAWCWGKMKDRTSLVPVRVNGLPKLKQLTTEWSMACGLTEQGAVYCWGESEVVGVFITRAQPALIAGAPAFTSISAGNFHTCGLTSQGAAWCWGFNQTGQIGAAQSPVLQATAVPGGLQFTMLAVAGFSTCGLTASGARCLGGSILPGSEAVPRVFVTVPKESEHPFVSLEGGSWNACGIDAQGGAWCWGSNTVNQITPGEDRTITEPRQLRIPP
jgi:alpha-tubulin suppressor-like RCC1 family protein